MEAMLGWNFAQTTHQSGCSELLAMGRWPRGVCKEGKRKEENLKRRNLERESGKVLLVAFVDSWMRGSAWCRHDPQSRSSGVFHTVCRSLQDHQ